MIRKMIKYPLFHNKVDIKGALHGVASQENCDGPEHDLMVCAAEYIQRLEELNDYLSAHLKDLDPEFVKIVTENFWDLWLER